MFDRLFRSIPPDLLEEALRDTPPEAPEEDEVVVCFHSPEPSPELPATDQIRVEEEEVLRSVTNALREELKRQPGLTERVTSLPEGTFQREGSRRLYRLMVAKNLLSAAVGRIGVDYYFPFGSRILRIPFTVEGVDVAADSQGENFNVEKINIALRQSLSYWTAVVPLTFQAPLAGESPLLRIFFDSDGSPSQAIGTASGAISSTPNGPLGEASVHIDCDNELFVDRYQEEDRLPVMLGPFDLIYTLTHEIGHALGLDHWVGAEPSIMTDSQAPKFVKRGLFPVDIQNIQELHGAVTLGQPARADLSTAGELIEASPGITLSRDPDGILIRGPMQTKAVLEVRVPAQGRLVNALRLKFTTFTQNIFVNRVRTFDGSFHMQGFAHGGRNAGTEGMLGRAWDLLLGFQPRREMQGEMVVQLEILLTAKEGGVGEIGMILVQDVTVETLLPPPVLAQG